MNYLIKLKFIIFFMVSLQGFAMGTTQECVLQKSLETLKNLDSCNNLKNTDKVIINTYLCATLQSHYSRCTNLSVYGKKLLQTIRTHLKEVPPKEKIILTEALLELINSNTYIIPLGHCLHCTKR